MIIGFKKRHRQNLDHNLLRSQFKKFALILVIIILLHILAMMFFESMDFMDALWLTITSVTTVGYGDIFAKTIYGRLSTIILIYICGIAILAQVAVMYFEHKHEIKKSMLKGDWSWKMKNHIVFINSPNTNGENYFFKAISEIRSSNSALAKLPIIIVSELFEKGLSERLRKLNVNHVRGLISEKDILKNSNIKEANIIVIIAQDHDDSRCDGVNFDLVDRLREMGVDARIIVEVVNDENRGRLRKAGANNILRPIRSYPELLARSVVTPGSEQILESLFNNLGVQCVRYDIEGKKKWIDVIDNLAKENLGLPIAYESTEGEIVINPKPHDTVATKAIFVILAEGKITACDKVQKAIFTS